ncbi:hypothetical protein BGW42_000189, partial [Actinomortierella wolfii]
MNPPNPQDPTQGLFTFNALLEQARQNSLDPANFVHHVQTAFESLQQQLNTLQQELAVAQASQAGNSPDQLRSLVQTLAERLQESAQMNQSVHSNMQRLMDTISKKPSPSLRSPSPLTPKFKGDSSEMSVADFKARLTSAFARYPEAFVYDSEKIHFALQSMEGAPFKLFTPYVNGESEDTD